MGRKNSNDTELECACAYCENASPLHDRDHMLCSKRGVVGSGFSCRHFSYDPLKRIPIPRRSVQSDLDLPELP